MRSRVHPCTELREKDACLLLSSGPLCWQQEKRGLGFLALNPEGMKIRLVNVVNTLLNPSLTCHPSTVCVVSVGRGQEQFCLYVV